MSAMALHLCKRIHKSSGSSSYGLLCSLNSHAHRTSPSLFSTSAKYFSKSSDDAVQPFHMSFPVRSIDEARSFYGGVLGWEEGRSHKNWIDYSCFGHQVVCHWVGNDFKAIDYHNPVDGDEVPVPHFGVCMEVDQFHEFAQKVKDAGIPFVIEPHLRFEGMPGEQFTMFFKDPSNNNLEFKAMTNPDNLFAKYEVID